MRLTPQSQSLPLSAPRRGGFTLIEILVTMSIILILAGIVIGVQRGVYRKQSESKAKGEMQAIATALESYKLKYGDYPWFQYEDTDAKKTELFKHLTGEKYMGVDSTGTAGVQTGTKKPVLDSAQFKTATTTSGDEYFVDPWGKAYRYYYKTSNAATWNLPGGFILISLGPDGKTATSATTAFETGSLPNVKTHYESSTSKTDGRLDDLIYGLEF